jgi:hypothetical protein
MISQKLHLVSGEGGIAFRAGAQEHAAVALDGVFKLQDEVAV